MWKIFPKDTRYEVSDMGEVRMINNKNRTPSSTPAGYQVIVTSNPNGIKKGYYVHRMVLESFVGECPDGMCVSHKNGVNTDNRLSNLIYETQTENLARKKQHGTYEIGASHHSSKLSQKEAEEIRASHEKPKVLASKYNVSYRVVRRILNRETYLQEYGGNPQ